VDRVLQNAPIVIAAQFALFVNAFAHVVAYLYQAGVNVKIAKSNAVVSLVMDAETKAVNIAVLVIQLALLIIYVLLRIVQGVMHVIHIRIVA